jgi:hypothetical protein
MKLPLKNKTIQVLHIWLGILCISSNCATFTPDVPESVWNERHDWVPHQTQLSPLAFVSDIKNIEFLINSPLSPVHLISGFLQYLSILKQVPVRNQFESAALQSIIQRGTVLQFHNPNAAYGSYGGIKRSIIANSHPLLDPLVLPDGIGYFTMISFYGHQDTDAYCEIRFYLNKTEDPQNWYMWKQSFVKLNESGKVVDSFTGSDDPPSTGWPYARNAREFILKNYPNISLEKIPSKE